MYRIETTEEFDKKVKKLAKRYPGIKNDLLELYVELEKGIIIGDKLKWVGKWVFKARLGSSDQTKWKRGGFRTIYYVVNEDNLILLITIYAKSQKENIRPDEILRILAEE